MSEETERILAKAAIWRKELEEQREVLLKRIDDSYIKLAWSSSSGKSLAEPLSRVNV